jgi:hypothetical protein
MSSIFGGSSSTSADSSLPKGKFCPFVRPAVFSALERKETQ